MRIILDGKMNDMDVLEALKEAVAQAYDIIVKEEPDLEDTLTKECDEAYVKSAVFDIGFDMGDGELLSLVTDKDEILTFRFNVDDEGNVKLEGSNKDEPIFSDTDRAYVDLQQGLSEVTQQLDVSSANEIYHAKTIGGLDIHVYDNNTAQYFKDGKLVQETTIREGMLTAFIAEIKDLVGDIDEL